jgi:integrase
MPVAYTRAWASNHENVSMSDTRYLKKQGHAWSFCMTVPKELRSAFPSDGRRIPDGRRLAGKPREKIVVALDTQSLSEAQERRWPLVQEWREKFKRAKAKVPITVGEIDQEAREHYHYLLDTMAATPPDEVTVDGNLHAAADALEDEAWETAEAEVRRVERRKGVAIERGTSTHELVAKAMLTARLSAFEGRVAMMQGKPSDEPATFLGADGIDPVTLRPIASLPRPLTRIRTSDGVTFEEAAARYLDELRTSSITAQTLLRTERVFALFKSYAGNPPLAAIDKDTAHDFITKIASLDPSWGAQRGSDKMPFAKLIEAFGQGKRHLSNATINKYVHSLSALFSWAERKTNFEGRNPFQGQSRKKPDAKLVGWKAYSIDELKKLFAVRSERVELWWLPLIALYSGMRLGEIAQLQASDLVRKKGVWCFEVSASGDGQHVKTDAAVRIVPVHSKLIEAGLLDYRKGRDGQLWPGLRRGGPDNKLGWHFSAQFTQYRRACGVDGPRLTFHSFRKNAAQALKDARATPAEIAELIGHERGFTVETYAPLGLPLPALQELVERIKYPGLRL